MTGETGTVLANEELLQKLYDKIGRIKEQPDQKCCLQEIPEEDTIIQRLLDNPKILCLIAILVIAIVTIIVLSIKHHKKSKKS